APTISTPTSAGITSSGATLGGNVTNDNGSAITARGVVYALTSTNSNPEIGGTGATTVSGSGTTGVFTVTAGGLLPGMAYSFKAYATNSIGTTYTSAASFTTPVTTPTVNTPLSQDLTQTSASLGGTVATDGGGAIIERGVVYSLSATNTQLLLNGAGVTRVVGTGTTGAFVVSATGLTLNTTYSFTAYATNSAGTSYSTAGTFTTLAIAPSVTTHPSNRSLTVGDTATFTAVASGDPTPALQWQLSTDGGSTWTNIANATSATYSFTTTMSDHAKRYRAQFSNVGGSANSDVAVLAVIGAPFSDEPLMAGSTPARAIHITELRNRIDGLRIRHGLAAFTWTDPALVAGITSPKRVHLTELRTALNEAYVQAGRTPPTYTDTPVADVTTIRAIHIAELRAAVIALEAVSLITAPRDAALTTAAGAAPFARVPWPRPRQHPARSVRR
ncbi:MAG: hypothetical protein KA205_08540, partial [Acidobacteria bacterium]|nr:hypothetical protein [Acidobacteriota bacterium]